MGLLRVLDLGAELAGSGRQEVGAVGVSHLGTDCIEGFVAEHHVVGTHVGDVATLVQALGDAHHLCGAEPQFAAALLLQRARHERRLRAAAVG
ncbi:MAG: hypothetical protein RIT23_1165, partial [Actinomycetota bacterium]